MFRIVFSMNFFYGNSDIEHKGNHIEKNLAVEVAVPLPPHSINSY